MHIPGKHTLLMKLLEEPIKTCTGSRRQRFKKKSKCYCPAW